MSTYPWNDDWLEQRGNYQTIITPDVAKRLLERNTNNRNPSKIKVAQYVREMVAGRWNADASDLKFSSTGELLDGQQRLLACVQSGKAFPTLVRTGLDDTIRSKIDTGKSRRTSDIIRIMRSDFRGSVTGLAAAVQLRHRYTERMRLYRGERGFDWKAPTLSPDEVLLYLDEHPTMERYASLGQSLYQSVTDIIPASVWIAAVGWFAEIDEDAMVEFARQLREGTFRGIGDPLAALLGYAARRAARRPVGSGRGGVWGRINQEEHLIALIRTWNAWRSKQDMPRLTVRKNDRLVVPI